MSREQEIAQLKTTLSLDTGDFKKQLTSVSKETNNLKRSFDIANKSIENAEDKVEATTNAISKGERAIESMNKKLQMQKQRYDDLKSTVDKQSKAYNELTEELNKAEKELEELENAENKNVDAIEKQKRAIDDLKKKLQDKAQLIDKNINSLQKYSNDIDKTENDITGLGSQLNRLRGSLDDTAQATEDMSKASKDNGLGVLGELAESTGINIGLLEAGAKGAAIALVGMITKKIIDAAGTYDKAITDLKITMGLTEEKANELYDAISDIADGGYSIEGITDAVKMLEQRFGLSAEESEELAQGIDLLNKYGYESKDVVRFMTTAVNDWGMEYEEALDYILKGQQEGLNMSEDWMDTLVEYAPIFSTLGITGNDAFILIREAMKATGVDSDKAADMVKELMLTLTDGSDTSAKALGELGLDVDDLTGKINDGSITSVEAMQEIMKAIVGMGDETEKSRLLQETFKGTIEYGSIGIVEAWNNIGNEVINTTGTIENAKLAYEDSYEAMKQDLTQSWSELTQMIGSEVLPGLKAIVDALIAIPFNMEVAGQQISLSWEWAMAHLSNTWLGFQGVFQEGLISILEGLQQSADKLGMKGIAESMGQSIDSMKSKHSELVEEIKTNEDTIKNNSDKLGKLWNESWNGTLEEKKATFKRIMGETTDISDTESKAMSQQYIMQMKRLAKEAGVELENTSQKTSETMEKTKKDITTKSSEAATNAQQNFSNMKMDVDTEMSGVSSSVGTNLDESVQAMRQAGSDIYNGMTTSFERTATEGKQHFSNLYNGVTNSTSKMADKAIEDWKRIRTEYSKTITGQIIITTTNRTVNETVSKSSGESRSNIEVKRSLIDNVSRIDVSPYDFTSGYYTPNTQSSRSVIKINKDINNLSSLENKFEKLIDALSNNKTINQNNNINITAQEPLSPSQVAYNTRKELERLGRRL